MILLALCWVQNGVFPQPAQPPVTSVLPSRTVRSGGLKDTIAEANVLPKQKFKLLNRDRPAKQIALVGLAPEIHEELPLCLGFNSLSDYRQAHCPAERDNGLCNRPTMAIGQDIPHESPIDFELVQRQAFQIPWGGAVPPPVGRPRAQV